MKKVNLLFRLLLVSFLVAADYVAKVLVRASMYPGESIPLIGDILRVIMYKITQDSPGLFRLYQYGQIMLFSSS
jgi:lipoprotein signal peptidase